MTANSPNITVEPSGTGAWSLATERRVGTRAARGTAVVVAMARPDPAAPSHAELAGARAWAALGAECLAAGDASDAVTAARAGIEELGDDYRPRGVKDDTLMKIDAAEERIAEGAVAEGAVAEGAAVLLRMLEARIQMYVQNHSPDVR